MCPVQTFSYLKNRGNRKEKLKIPSDHPDHVSDHEKHLPISRYPFPIREIAFRFT